MEQAIGSQALQSKDNGKGIFHEMVHDKLGPVSFVLHPVLATAHCKTTERLRCLCVNGYCNAKSESATHV